MKKLFETLIASIIFIILLIAIWIMILVASPVLALTATANFIQSCNEKI